MPSPARFLALPLAVGSLVLGPGVATAAPRGGTSEAAPAPKGETTDDAEPTAAGSAAAGLDGLRARASQAKRKARAKADAATGDDASLSKRKDRPWVQRWAPERNMVELGVFGGILVPARDLELFQPRTGRPRQGFLPLATVAPDVGVRVGYYPLRYLGLEVEGATMPTATLEDGFPAQLWAARGHVIAQLPFSSIAPFVVVGAGAFGMTSHPLVLGDDIDPAIHLGIGTKVFIDRRLALRLDLRDQISPRRGADGGATNSIEALLGLSLTLGRLRDRDQAPAPAPAPRPEPPRDPDGDGFVGKDDACPTAAGVAPDGCPDRDADRDGVLVPDDACPDAAEEPNGFDDADGCPDTLPDAVQQFNGRLEGVNFELSRATLTKASLPVLDQAVEALLQYPTVRIEISGHTDNTGRREVNMRLSLNRAEAVKKYLVEHGVDAGRIITRGAGPDEPIDSNSTREGRASNRRIEFRVLE